jgi:hypothetical protein
MGATTGRRKEDPGFKRPTRPSPGIPHARRIGSRLGSVSLKPTTVIGGIGDKAPDLSSGDGHLPLWHGLAMDNHTTLPRKFLVSPSLNKHLKPRKTGSSAGKSYTRSKRGCTSMLVWLITYAHVLRAQGGLGRPHGIQSGRLRNQ